MLYVQVKGLMVRTHNHSPGEPLKRTAAFHTLIREGLNAAGLTLRPLTHAVENLYGPPLLDALVPFPWENEVVQLRDPRTGAVTEYSWITHTVLAVLDNVDVAEAETVAHKFDWLFKGSPMAHEFPYSAWQFTESPS